MSPLALVTGASSGIGQAFAQRLASDGYDLIVVGRRKDRLEELGASLPDVKAQVVAADLSTDAGVDKVAELCASQSLTMLVNNAGVAHYMPISELSPIRRANWCASRGPAHRDGALGSGSGEFSIMAPARIREISYQSLAERKVRVALARGPALMRQEGSRR